MHDCALSFNGAEVVGLEPSDTSMFHFRYVNIFRAPTHVTVIELSMVCRIIGHRFQDTFVIREEGDFFEVEDAQYCRNCGTVHPNLQAN